MYSPQSSEPARNKVGESEKTITRLFAPNGASDPPILKTLTAAVLLKLLTRRLINSIREFSARFATVLYRVRLRISSGMVPVSVVAALRAAARSGRDARGQITSAPSLSIGPVRRWRFVVIVALVSVPMAYAIYCIATIPVSGGPSVQPSSGALVVEADDGRAFATRGIFKGEKTSADHVPAVLADAATAIEDRRFYSHGGVDLRAMLRAAWHDLLGRKVEGGSTITQQLARTLYLSPERSLRRKVQEAILAIWLEFHLSKKQILARYLDAVYFGDSAYGVDAAAKHYFGKSAQELTLSEAAMLAGLIRAPSALAPDRNLDGARERANVVLDAMVKNGAISEQQAAAARQKPAVLRIPAGSPPGSNYFIDTAAAEVRSVLGPNAEDLTIRTTLNRQMQEIAEHVIAKRLATIGQAKNVHEAALVAMAPDGAILALVGGRDYRASQFNRATQARRQPGSLFKLFVYLAAMRSGLTPDTVMVDRPISVGEWEPENYGNRYHGAVTLRTAFAQSLNSVAVQVAESVGVQNVIETAKQLGIRSDLPAVPSVALGTGEVTLLDMTRAFAAVATNKTSVDAYTSRAIRKGDQALYTKPVTPPTANGDPLVHTEMMDLLSSVVREGTGKAARLDRPVAGKTGTSQGYRNAWFIGFSSDLVVGVWVGNDDNSAMNNVTGGSLPATIWHDFMSDAETVRRPGSALAIAAARPDAEVPPPAGRAPPLSVAAPTNPAANAVLRGRAIVLDTGALELQGQVIRLNGVDGIDSRHARTLRRMLRLREAVCTPAGDNSRYDCRVGNVDLSELVSPSRGFVSNADDDEEPNAAGDVYGNGHRRGFLLFQRFFHW